MAATIHTPPADVSLSLSPVWVTIETDIVANTPAYFQFIVTGSGPTVGQEVELTWPGGSVTYTVASSISEGGGSWPTKGGGESLSDYADRLLEWLHHAKVVTDVFTPTREADSGSNPVLRLTHIEAGTFAIAQTNNLSNVTVSAYTGAAVSALANPRAYVEVYRSTGNLNTDNRLAAFHAPYNISTAQALFDIASAFFSLRPSLPLASSINPSFFISLNYGEAVDCFTAYYLRYADSGGYPAIPSALLRSANDYLAIYGGRPGDALSTDTDYLRHSYRRRDGGVFIKHISSEQPDWVYWLNKDDSLTGIYVSVLITWSDGSTSTYNPFGTTLVPVEVDRVYWIASGYKQMRLHNQTHATDPDAYIVAYEWRIAPASGLGVYYLGAVKYSLLWDSDSPYYLAYSNGMGGIETVWMRGRQERGYRKSAQEYRRTRTSSYTPAEGDFFTIGNEGRATYRLSTGWYTLDQHYIIEHLQQLLVGECWLVDVANRRFLSVSIATTETVASKSDDTLLSIEVDVIANWADPAYNH